VLAAAIVVPFAFLAGNLAVDDRHARFGLRRGVENGSDQAAGERRQGGATRCSGRHATAYIRELTRIHNVPPPPLPFGSVAVLPLTVYASVAIPPVGPHPRRR